ncbi:hypothetical protein C9994_00415 [Marivirga lumbricoides]|uniref:Lipoprotein n=1 Tax=Marivirga lumbricoides TaxID=1046115 RepID=A0A2T4DVU1_9BACT|nr:hypothetical protein C9994_00415 [Marivirga lumbricoides]
MKKNNSFTIRKLTLLIPGIVVAILTLQSCQEDETTELTRDEEIAITENATFSEDVSDEDIELANSAEIEVGIQESASRESSSEKCYATTWDAATRILTIDFGEGCVGPYGRQRRGKIIVSYGEEGNYYVADRTITFDNYFVNGNQITGELYVEKAVINEEGFYENNYTVNYTILFNGGTTFTLNGSRKREWIAGVLDDNFANNVFRITGSLTGISTRGISWSHQIVEPIIADFNCRSEGNFLYTQGIKEISYSNSRRKRTRTVDYGDGICDRSYTIAINNDLITITAE